MAASYAAESAEGVTDADDNPDEQMLTVIFDDARTTIEKIKKTMAEEGFPVEGEPEFLNK